MSVTPEMLAELADSRFRGEGDLHFFARWTRQKSNRWLEATDTLASCRNRNLSDVVLGNLEAGERRARFELESTVELLSEELKKIGEANPSLPIHRVNNGR